MKPISAAHVIIINQHQEMLVLHIGEHKVQPERSFTPDIPGGFVAEHESERGGLVRELREETGIVVREDQLRLLFAETSPQPDKQVMINKLIYLLVLDHTPEVKVSWEHESYEWVPIVEVSHKLGLGPRHQKVVDYIVQENLYEKAI